MTKVIVPTNDQSAVTGDPVFPRMLTPAQVQEILNAKSSLVYALVRGGELPAGQFGRRGIWRVRESDLAAYIEAAFAETAARVAAGEISEEEHTIGD